MEIPGSGNRFCRGIASAGGYPKKAVRPAKPLRAEFKDSTEYARARGNLKKINSIIFHILLRSKAATEHFMNIVFSSLRNAFDNIRSERDNGTCRLPDAGVTQLVECDLAKVDVAGSNPVSRSIPPRAARNHRIPAFLNRVFPVTAVRLSHFDPWVSPVCSVG